MNVIRIRCNNTNYADKYTSILSSSKSLDCTAYVVCVPYVYLVSLLEYFIQLNFTAHCLFRLCVQTATWHINRSQSLRVGDNFHYACGSCMLHFDSELTPRALNMKVTLRLHSYSRNSRWFHSIPRWNGINCLMPQFTCCNKATESQEFKRSKDCTTWIISFCWRISKLSRSPKSKQVWWQQKHLWGDVQKEGPRSFSLSSL